MWFKRIVFIIAVIIFVGVVCSIAFAVGTDTTLCRICYPDSECRGILAQTRQVKNGKNRQNFVKNLAEEVILGPIDASVGLNRKKPVENVFPKEAKLLSAFVTDDTAYLNFNKELLLNIPKNFTEAANKSDKNLSVNSTEKNICKFSLNYLILYSIIDTISINCRDISKFYISFDGMSYRYIDDFGPTDGELSADYSVLLR